MLDLAVQRKTKTAVKIFGLFGWLAIFVTTTYLYFKKGCPHTETTYSSSCKTYTYSAGLVPASTIPPVYIYEPITIAGNATACYMERFLFTFVDLKTGSSGYIQNFHSEIYCYQGDGLTGNFSSIPSISYGTDFNSTGYQHIAYVDSPSNDAVSVLLEEIVLTSQGLTGSLPNITQLSCYYIQGRAAYTTCGVLISDKGNETAAPPLNITVAMKEYFDYSTSLANMLNEETPYSCDRCRLQDITFDTGASKTRNAIQGGVGCMVYNRIETNLDQGDLRRKLLYRNM
ncbi:hypothetical protein BGZ58_010698 [Dissophora ornata]|nr:hypothetical protein BGZ58_010698 [Dissophora ornata]